MSLNREQYEDDNCEVKLSAEEYKQMKAEQRDNLDKKSYV